VSNFIRAEFPIFSALVDVVFWATSTTAVYIANIGYIVAFQLHGSPASPGRQRKTGRILLKHQHAILNHKVNRRVIN